ncbi:hypothetical protein ACXZ66_09955 [Corynebacterium sp. S7]
MKRESRESFQAIEFSSVDEFVRTFECSMETSNIEINDVNPLQFRWINRRAKNTIVTFSAAISRNKASEVPIFSGWGLTKTLNANVLMVSDPSLAMDADLNLAWYLGNESQPEYLDQLTLILKVFAANQSLVLFGASGGGFAALLQGSRIPGVRVVVSNPQTDIKLFSYYPTYRNIAWNGAESLPVTTSVLQTYEENHELEIVYIQNRDDSDHYNNHWKPFEQVLNSEIKIYPIVKALGEGHIGPDVQSFQAVLEVVLESESWASLTENLAEVEIFSTRTRPVA